MKNLKIIGIGISKINDEDKLFTLLQQMNNNNTNQTIQNNNNQQNIMNNSHQNYIIGNTQPIYQTSFYSD